MISITITKNLAKFTMNYSLSPLYILCLLPFIFIFYIESIQLAGISFGIVWKAIFLGIIAVILLQSIPKKSQITRLNFLSYLIAFKYLIFIDSTGDWLVNVSEGIKYFCFPMILHFLHVRHFTLQNKIRFLIAICVVASLSCLPFLLGVIEPLVSGYNLSIYGVDERGFVGIFQNPHSAAISLAFSLIVLLYFIPSFRTITGLIFLLCIFISVIAIYNTYVRTAWLMALVPLLFVILNIRNLRNLVGSLFFLGFFSISILFLFQSSEIFQMRLTDTNIYTMEGDNQSLAIGSGRLNFWYGGIIAWLQSDPLAILIGSGLSQSLENMNDVVGARVIAHNIFVDTLNQSGLIGLFILILFLLELYKIFKLLKGSSFYKLYRNTFYAFFIYLFFQGTQFFLVDVIFALVISIALVASKSLTPVK